VKILLAGDWHSRVHEEPMAEGLRTIGHEVDEFRWNEYFAARSRITQLVRKAQNKYLVGPRVDALNRDLIRIAKADLLFIYRGTHIKRETLQRIRAKNPSIIIAGYNNDDPFSQAYGGMWRHFLAAVPAYDIVFAYRYSNLDELARAGARRTALLRSWFVPERIKPMQLSDDDRKKYESDVSFIGHYENDGRAECIEAVAKSGAKVRMFGPGRDYKQFGWRDLSIHPVWNDDYNKALCGAKIALAFLSKLNRDTYTRRSFEIPASGTMMLSEYTDDLATLFKEGEEAEFFRSPEELVEKVRYYLANDDARRRIAEGGLRRVYADGHDVQSRMRKMIETIQEIRP
jgi:spore maturation protein CgeB